MDKNAGIEMARGDLEMTMTLTPMAIAEITWWLHHAIHYPRPAIVPNIDSVIFTDASTVGWGAVLDGVRTNGHWSVDEQDLHINALEILAIKYGLQALCTSDRAKHIQIRSDNTTAVANINDMGSCHSIVHNQLTHEIWLWAIERDI